MIALSLKGSLECLNVRVSNLSFHGKTSFSFSLPALVFRGAICIPPVSYLGELLP